LSARLQGEIQNIAFAGSFALRFPAFNLNPGAPVKTINPDSIDLSGDVTWKFSRAKAPF
jgi:hypothetical protein